MSEKPLQRNGDGTDEVLQQEDIFVWLWRKFLRWFTIWPCDVTWLADWEQKSLVAESLNSKVRHATTVVVSIVQLSFQGPSIILILPTSQFFSTRFTRAFPTKTYYNPIQISPSIRATVWTTQQFAPLQQQVLLHDPRNTKLTPVQYTIQYLTLSLPSLNPSFAQIFFPNPHFQIFVFMSFPQLSFCQRFFVWV